MSEEMLKKEEKLQNNEISLDIKEEIKEEDKAIKDNNICNEQEEKKIIQNDLKGSKENKPSKIEQNENNQNLISEKEGKETNIFEKTGILNEENMDKTDNNVEEIQKNQNKANKENNEDDKINENEKNLNIVSDEKQNENNNNKEEKTIRKKSENLEKGSAQNILYTNNVKYDFDNSQNEEDEKNFKKNKFEFLEKSPDRFDEDNKESSVFNIKNTLNTPNQEENNNSQNSKDDSPTFKQLNFESPNLEDNQIGEKKNYSNITFGNNSSQENIKNSNEENNNNSISIQNSVFTIDNNSEKITKNKALIESDNKCGTNLDNTENKPKEENKEIINIDTKDEKRDNPKMSGDDNKETNHIINNKKENNDENGLIEKGKAESKKITETLSQNINLEKNKEKNNIILNDNGNKPDIISNRLKPQDRIGNEGIQETKLELGLIENKKEIEKEEIKDKTLEKKFEEKTQTVFPLSNNTENTNQISENIILNKDNLNIKNNDQNIKTKNENLSNNEIPIDNTLQNIEQKDNIHEVNKQEESPIDKKTKENKEEIKEKTIMKKKSLFENLNKPEIYFNNTQNEFLSNISKESKGNNQENIKQEGNKMLRSEELIFEKKTESISKVALNELTKLNKLKREKSEAENENNIFENIKNSEKRPDTNINKELELNNLNLEGKEENEEDIQADKKKDFQDNNLNKREEYFINKELSLDEKTRSNQEEKHEEPKTTKKKKNKNKIDSLMKSKDYIPIPSNIDINREIIIEEQKNREIKNNPNNKEVNEKSEIVEEPKNLNEHLEKKNTKEEYLEEKKEEENNQTQPPLLNACTTLECINDRPLIDNSNNKDITNTNHKETIKGKKNEKNEDIIENINNTLETKNSGVKNDISEKIINIKNENDQKMNVKGENKKKEEEKNAIKEEIIQNNKEKESEDNNITKENKDNFNIKNESLNNDNIINNLSSTIIRNGAKNNDD